MWSHQTGPYKRAYIAALQRLLRSCHNPQAAAINEVEMIHLMDRGSWIAAVKFGSEIFLKIT